MLGYLSLDITIICSEKRAVFRENILTKNISFEKQMMSKDKYLSEHIFALNGGYCVNYPSKRFRNTVSFESGEYHSEIRQFKAPPTLQRGNLKTQLYFDG